MTRSSFTAGNRKRRLLAVAGTIAAVAGTHTAVAGGRSYPPWRRHDPQVESELRFYAAFYALYGLGLLDAARRNRTDPRTINLAATGLLAGGVGRAVGWIDAGRPHPLQQVLLAIELGGPAVVIAAQRRGL